MNLHKNAKALINQVVNVTKLSLEKTLLFVIQATILVRVKVAHDCARVSVGKLIYSVVPTTQEIINKRRWSQLLIKLT